MRRVTEQDIQALTQSDSFDPAWYEKEYPDVKMLGMDPATHYLAYGSLMGRSPGPDFPAKFIREVFVMKPETEPVARLARLTREQGAPPTPKPKKVLSEASKLVRLGDSALALTMARRYLPPELQYTVHILEANAALRARDFQGWQDHVNAYLSHLGVPPIALRGMGTPFDRLACAQDLPPVADGPLISVLMPAWNAEKTVRKAAQSILAQTWRNLELLIVDDASTDGTPAIIQDIAAQDPRVRTFRNAVNVGPYVSKNIALRHARGEWITGQDADDWSHPHRLERQVEFCQTQNVPACLSGMVRISSYGKFVRFNEIGEFVHDAVCRSAFVSLMTHGQYFHDLLGNWDEVRTSADSEILRRIEALQGKPVAKLTVCTMFCLDNPEGLTNHPVLGHSESRGVSPFRKLYKAEFQKFHKTLTRETSRLEFPQKRRRFPAPDEILCPKETVEHLVSDYRRAGELNQALSADIVIATDLGFPGGNASSTIDEIKYFTTLGLTVRLISCPANNDLGKPISKRYAPYQALIVHWSQIDSVTCQVLICRNPVVATSMAFARVAPKITATHAFIVKNNSSKRTTGVPVYDIKALIEAGRRIAASHLTICPISPVMRAELQAHQDKIGAEFTLSEMDWTPTFDLALYKQAPKESMSAPFRIGRHGRDGAEKWLEDPDLLRRAFPCTQDFRVKILGGAKQARKILRNLPKNWEVFDFGSIEPFDYLRELDVFVYFPNTGLSEGFGRTIVEAMLAGVPVLLPPRFAETFDDLPLYCRPEHVEHVVRRLAHDDAGRRRYLEEVQNIAVERYSSAAIQRRVAGTNLPTGAQRDASAPLELSPTSLAYRQAIMNLAPIIEPMAR
jgi:hypothetical protein